MVGDSPRLGHELVDPEDQRHPRHRDAGHHREGRGQRDESGPRDPGRPLARDHGHHQYPHLLAEGELNAHGLSNEERGQGHVDVGAVQVERVAGRDHQADDRARQADPLQLLHQGDQRRLRGAGRQDQQELALDVPQQEEDVEAGHAGDAPQHDEDKCRAGRIEQQDQRSQRQERPQTELADGKGDRGAGAQRRRKKDHPHHPKEHLAGRLDQLHDGPRILGLQESEGEPQEDRDEQHLENVPLRKGAEERSRNHLQ